MDSVQMATSAGRTAGTLLTLFYTAANRHTAKTFTILATNPSVLTVWSLFSRIKYNTNY